MISTMDVSVLGAAAVDLVARVDRLPGKDEISFANQFSRFVGGSGANIAAGLANLGRSVSFLGKTGDDKSGIWIAERMQSFGIDTRSMRKDPGSRSAECFIAIDNEGNRVIYALGGSALLEKIDDEDLQTIRQSRVFCIVDALMETARRAAAAAEARDVPVFFMPGGLMASRGIKELAPILEKTNVLIMSRIESKLISGENSPEGAACLLKEFGLEAVVITLGKKGALIKSAEGVESISAYQSSVIDTTGAGDAFAAGFIDARLDGLPWGMALQAGCAMSALKIRHLGATSGLPDKEELESFMKTRISQ